MTPTPHPLRRVTCWCVLVVAIGACSQGSPVAPGGPVDAGAGEETGGEDLSPDCRDCCETDDACPVDQVCAAGQCAPGCRFDGACADGSICVDAACVAGCRDPADCPPGHTCRALVCVFEGCRNDSECGRGGRCAQGACVDVGEARCSSDAECGYRWRCLSDGVCHDRECLEHADCAQDRWCRAGVCAARAAEIGTLRFGRIDAPGIRDHWTGEVKTYGAGGGLLDIDGDGDEDLFLGGWDLDAGSPPCLYRNVSSPGAIAFTPVEEYCGHHLGKVVSAGGVDVDNDGRDELLLLGHEVQRLVRFHPEPSVTDLRDAIPRGDPRRACLAGAYAATDLDHDGLVDLLFGCQSLKQPRRIDQHNIALRQTAAGDFALFSDPLYDALEDDGVTLAVGVIDIDDDGLQDIVVVNDTFVREGAETNHLTTGAALFRCAPAAPCAFDRRLFAEGTRAWGSYMGVGSVDIHGAGPHLYITDWGANRLLAFDGRTPSDLAADYRVDLGTSLGLPLFGWAALVDDFDRNGLDDLLVTQGSASPDQFGGYTKHRDALLLQRGDGDFRLVDDEVGLGVPTHDDSGHDLRVYSSRGAAKADFDGDGYLDFVVTGLEGATKLFSELPTSDNAPTRCTLRPRPRVVPSYGVGYAVRAPWSDTWRRRDMQGQPRFGAAGSILTSHPAGRLRFPSGAEVEFDCSEVRVQTVTEPDWIQVTQDGPNVRVALDAPWRDPSTVEIALRSADGESVVPASRSDGDWVAAAHGTHAMVRLDGRWIARWWPLLAE